MKNNDVITKDNYKLRHNYKSCS